jgi:hypothetical protein
MHDVGAARDLVAAMVGVGSDRWHHSQTAAVGAMEVARWLPEPDRGLLVTAAWLHDIGYHHPSPPTGFHPIDGALLLLDAGWPTRVAALVAHHSEGRFSAAAHGLLAMLDEFPREEGPVADGLVYADMTAAPRGGRLTLPARLADIRRRHRPDAPAMRSARSLREPFLTLAVARSEVRISQGGGLSRQALPVPSSYVPAGGDIERLARDHPGRPHLDLCAALHASASLVHVGLASGPDGLVERAGRLLVATAGPRLLEQGIGWHSDRDTA